MNKQNACELYKLCYFNSSCGNFFHHNAKGYPSYITSFHCFFGESGFHVFQIHKRRFFPQSVFPQSVDQK